MNITQLFKEADGKWSSIRSQGWLVVGGFMADYGAHIYRAQDFNPSFAIVGLIVGILGLKMWQKADEAPVTPDKV